MCDFQGRILKLNKYIMNNIYLVKSLNNIIHSVNLKRITCPVRCLEFVITLKPRVFGTRSGLSTMAKYLLNV